MSGSLYQYAVESANQYGVPPGLFTSIIQAESGFNPSAYNSASGATGIAQFLPSTAANPGYGTASFDPTNPYQSLDGAAQYLSGLYNTTGSWQGAVNAYSGTAAGSNPYPNSPSVQQQITAADSGNPTNGQTQPAPAAPTKTSCGLDPVCWLGVFGSWLASFATRGALIVLAIVLLLGAMYLFAARTQQVSQSA